MIELEGMSCEKLLKAPGLSRLEKRRPGGDLIAVYNFWRRGSGEGSANLIISLVTRQICGNSTKKFSGRFRLGISKKEDLEAVQHSTD